MKIIYIIYEKLRKFLNCLLYCLKRKKIPYFEGWFIMSSMNEWSSTSEYLNRLSLLSDFFRSAESSLLCCSINGAMLSKQPPCPIILADGVHPKGPKPRNPNFLPPILWISCDIDNIENVYGRLNILTLSSFLNLNVYSFIIVLEFYYV